MAYSHLSQQRNKLEGSKLNDEEHQRFQDKISDLELDIIQKDYNIDFNMILVIQIYLYVFTEEQA